MRLTLSDNEGEVLNTWEIVEDYPVDFDFEDLDDDWAEDKIIISEVNRAPLSASSYGRQILREIQRMWEVGRR